MYSVIDMHCDTAFEIYKRKMPLHRNNCHIDLEKISKYNAYAQFFAIWANKEKSDEECFEDFLAISDNLVSQIRINEGSICQADNFEEFQNAFNIRKAVAFLAVEDARILCGELDRLNLLKDRGVKYLTLLWGGDSIIGGAHDTQNGLSAFGENVVRRCFEVGIVPDISHASEQSADDIIRIALQYQRPVIASHSNCYEQYSHSRNLRRRHLDNIIALGGLVGINLCRAHLCESDAKISHVCDHIQRYLEFGAQNVLCLGCDLDGTDLPCGINHSGDLYKIADALVSRGYSDKLIEKIMWQNCYTFIKNNF
ncbi:MAG: hypothetical protein E7667_01920 [Ruminococcaceae bacterium]|nr:hypothetical protein [Oscillospiraceae bacterium]